MSEIKIDSGIPIPENNLKSKGISRALRKMQIGESIFVAGIKPGNLGGRVGYVKLQTGFKFTSRSLAEKGVQGVRIWRKE